MYSEYTPINYKNIELFYHIHIEFFFYSMICYLDWCVYFQMLFLPFLTICFLPSHFPDGPLAVELKGLEDPIIASKPLTVECRTGGSRPPPTVSWSPKHLFQSIEPPVSGIYKSHHWVLCKNHYCYIRTTSECYCYCVGDVLWHSLCLTYTALQWQNNDIYSPFC